MMIGFHLKDSPWHVRLPILVGLLVWMGFHIWVLSYHFGVTSDVAVWDAFVFNVLTVGAILLLSMLIPRLPKAGVFQLTVALSVLMTLLVPWVGDQILLQLVTNSDYELFLAMAYPVRLAITFVIISGSGIALSFYTRWREQKNTKEIDTDITLMAKEAELQKLQQQLQPHFLFNSLNSINALIIIEPDRARVMVQQLSDFLRATLVRSDEKWITLKDELDYLELYLSIEKVRFGHRLNIEVDADDQIKLWLIPPLLIQPLVENAIKFGLYGTTEEVLIKIKISRSENSLQMEITNPFDQDMLPPSGSGFGLNGLRRRLYLLYAQNDLLNTSIHENQFTVQLTLPEKL